MATIDAFRTARCYAPLSAVEVLRDSSSVPRLVLALDVDALERSARARVDRVMLLSLNALAATGTHIALLARYERHRAALIERIVPGAVRASFPSLPSARALYPDAPAIVLTDDPQRIAELAIDDRALVLGRPELMSARVSSIADTDVRALLWWLVERRQRAVAA